MTGLREGPATPTAWSVDGRRFHCAGAITAGLPLGGFVEITDPAGVARIGQVLDLEVETGPSGHVAVGYGLLIDGGETVPPFDGATVTIPTDEAVQQALSQAPDPIVLGEVRGRPGVPATIAGRGFNRHTLLCGQSGSGKTYALGVLLERLLVHTTLPLVVLDPNGDHVHLGTPADGVDPGTAAAYRAATAGVRVARAEPDDDQLPLRIRLAELGAMGAGALLELDPVRDRDEYNALIHVEEAIPSTDWATVDEFVSALRATDDPILRDMTVRLENLGIDKMSVWALGRHRTVVEAWRDDDPRALIADTSALGSRRERVATTIAVLNHLWQRRREKQPLLLVVDEAHDVCPAQPTDRLQALAVDLFERIAGEGRKYGIHLLLASQRPDKLPENVVTQCDNLVLMRVNSLGDRRALSERFGFAPPALVELARAFDVGEALLAGRIAPSPILARIGRRVSREGGGDVPTDWAHPPDVTSFEG